MATSYAPIGCFKTTRKQLALPEMIADLTDSIDWSNLTKTIDACAKLVENRSYLYFGLQHFGLCRSGPLAHLSYDLNGPSKNCWSVVGGNHSYTNFVYMLGGKRKCHVLLIDRGIG